jgi:hypothetical protein
VTALGEAAAIILLLELLVVLIIFLAVAGGMAFGLHWVNGKTEWAFGKVNGWVEIGQRYVHKGTDLAMTPLIAGFALADRVRGTAEALREQVRGLRARRAEPIEVAARPVLPQPEEEPEAVVPLV